LSGRTNRIIGGAAPSQYLRRLEEGGPENPRIPRATLDACLRSHLIEPDFLRDDDFEGFWRDRREKLVGIIQLATGQDTEREEAEEDALEDEVIADGVIDAEDETNFAARSAL